MPSEKDRAEVIDEIILWLKGVVEDGDAFDTAKEARLLAVNPPINAEQAGYSDLALRGYREIGKLLIALKDKNDIAQGVLFQGHARRLGLVGKPFVLQGTTLTASRWIGARPRAKLCW